MTEEIHYCKNCKHAKVSFLEKILMGYEFAKCLAFPDIDDSNGETLVQGKEIKRYRFCHNLRQFDFMGKKTCHGYEEK